MQSRAKKLALVTGANKGIGLEITRQLGTSGCTVLLGARNGNLGRAAAAKLIESGLDVRCVELDLGRQETLADVGALIAREFGALDILVNNAGITDPADGTPSKANLTAVRRIMETNFIGALAVSQAMLPFLLKSTAGRIVNVSSGLGSLALHGDPKWEYASVKLIGYCASKAALNMLTVQMAYELRDTPVKVNSADPGYTATDLNNHSGHQTVQQGAAEAVRLALLGTNGPTGGFSDSNGTEPW